MISTPVAKRVAASLAGNYPLASTYHRDALAADLEAIVPRAEEAVAESTGLHAPGAADVALVGRTDWVVRNLGSFGHLLAPLEEALVERLGEDSAPSSLAAMLMSVEMGALLGLLSRRVLGQYELVLPTGEEGDVVSFVAPNLMEMERTHQFKPSDFRMWVALHEMAHRAQFQAVPWMKEYFTGLVESVVGAAIPRPGRFSETVREIIDRRLAGTPVIDDSGLIGLVSPPEQREVLDSIQALMSLLEGHGHVVMGRLGAKMLVSNDRMSRVLTQRRQDQKTSWFFKLTGLNLKMRQYEDGARFIDRVTERASWEALSVAWTEPGAVPTLAEIGDADKWLTRVA